VYGALLAGLRLAGKRELGQMTPFDLVVILLIANAVQNAMVGSDTSVSGGLIAAGVLIAINFVVAASRERVPFMRRALEGSPTLLIHDGQFIDANLRKERVDRDEVMTAIREHGIDHVDQVASAVLEIDGSISIVPKTEEFVRSRKKVRFLNKH